VNLSLSLAEVVVDGEVNAKESGGEEEENSDGNGEFPLIEWEFFSI